MRKFIYVLMTLAFIMWVIGCYLTYELYGIDYLADQILAWIQGICLGLFFGWVLLTKNWREQ
jgi:hypothetical protein